MKRYEAGPDTIVAVCDKGLIGKKFTQGEIVLNISEGFYKGSIAKDVDVVDALRSATIANLVGPEAVKCAIDNGFVDECNVIMIDGVPHAQMVLI
ncbi:MAG: DUF424 domain-containing protein [Halobacteriota archaeon]|nr:DUF424 domain-containing protein [Halobacteriota archaeon]